MSDVALSDRRLMEHDTGTRAEVPGAHGSALSSPSPPGCPDTATRTIGQKLSERWGQPSITENRVGAGGTIGTEYAAKAKPDGYTLLMGSSTELAVNPNLYTRLSYNTVRDFAPVALIAYTPLVLVAHPSLPVKTIKELAALAKARPGELNFASTGNGSTLHFAGEMFKRAANVSLVHVPHIATRPAHQRHERAGGDHVRLDAFVPRSRQGGSFARWR